MEWALVVEEVYAFVESGERLSSERNDWRYPGYDMIMCISDWLLTKHRFLCNSVIYDADYKVIRISNEYVLFVILFVLGECLYACMYSVGWLMYATAQQSQLFPFVRNWVSRRPESMCRGILPACLAGWLTRWLRVRLSVIDDHFRQRGAAIVCCSLVTLSSRSHSLSQNTELSHTYTHIVLVLSSATLHCPSVYQRPHTFIHAHDLDRERAWVRACVSLESHATFKRTAWLWPWQSASACIVSRVLEGRVPMASFTCTALPLLLFLLFQCCTITSTLQGNLSLSVCF